jgi:hypothetical protein
LVRKLQQELQGGFVGFIVSEKWKLGQEKYNRREYKIRNMKVQSVVVSLSLSSSSCTGTVMSYFVYPLFCLCLFI